MIQAYQVKISRDPITYFKPYSEQLGFWQSEKKNKCILGGNRSGKTKTGAAYVIKKCLAKPNQMWWGVTWADLSVSVQQKTIYDLLPKDNRIKYAHWNEIRGFTHRAIQFFNGSFIRFKTYDQGRDSFQGTARDGIWNDEEAPEDIYGEELIRLADRNGEMIRTMTPLNGFTYTYNDVILSENPDIDYWQWDSMNNPYINRDAFLSILRNYGSREADVRRKGLFINLRTGRMYYAYDRDRNKHRGEAFGVDPNYPIRLAFDFNVDPMITIIFQIVKGSKLTMIPQQDLIIKVIKVVKTENTTTEDQCKRLKAMLDPYNNPLIIYGDATKARSTLSESGKVNTTNWNKVKSVFPKAKYKVPESNPPVIERSAWVNAKLNNLNNEIGILLNSKGCEALEQDLEQVAWDKNHARKDKSNDKLTHASDALDYPISREFKIRGITQAENRTTKMAQVETHRATDIILENEEL